MVAVYAIVDPTLCRGRDPREVTRAVLRAGAGRVQLRHKHGSDRERLALAKDMAQLCADADIPFVVNDRVDLALLSGAAEVHLGQDDLRIRDARAIAPSLKIGVSTHDLAQALRARDDGADRIAVGPVFPTRSKERPDPVVGIELLETVTSLVDRPVVAIGGIDVESATRLRGLAISEVAVISAVCSADDPERAVRALREALAS